MTAKNRVVIELISGSGNFKGRLKIFKPHKCGFEERHHTGKVLKNAVCDECAKHRDYHHYAGGRIGDGYCLHPSHYGGENVTCDTLTAPETWNARAQLRNMGLNPDEWIIPHTTHGAWKITKNHGIVIVKNEWGAENDG